ncbi:MAG: hypothetical protein ACI8Z9_000651 [Paraglaciecola sp.]
MPGSVLAGAKLHNGIYVVLILRHVGGPLVCKVRAYGQAYCCVPMSHPCVHLIPTGLIDIMYIIHYHHLFNE